MQMAKQQGGEGGGRGATADTKKSRKGTVIEVYTADRLEQGKHPSNNVLKVNIQDKTALQETLNVSLRSPRLSPPLLKSTTSGANPVWVRDSLRVPLNLDFLFKSSQTVSFLAEPEPRPC